MKFVSNWAWKARAVGGVVFRLPFHLGRAVLGSTFGFGRDVGALGAILKTLVGLITAAVALPMVIWVTALVLAIVVPVVTFAVGLVTLGIVLAVLFAPVWWVVARERRKRELERWKKELERWR